MEFQMHLIRATLVENAIMPAQKQELISRVTDAVATIYGDHMRPNIWVLVEEIKSGQFAAGGHGVTTDEMRALIAGEPALKG
jgi:4-oxalocrotonate tautomerase